jgi:hypothetical protein
MKNRPIVANIITLISKQQGWWSAESSLNEIYLPLVNEIFPNSRKIKIEGMSLLQGYQVNDEMFCYARFCMVIINNTMIYNFHYHPVILTMRPFRLYVVKNKVVMILFAYYISTSLRAFCFNYCYYSQIKFVQQMSILIIFLA